MAGTTAKPSSKSQASNESVIKQPTSSDLAPAERKSAVLETISKRIRNARKRLRGIEAIEAKKLQEGNPLNADQEAALASKPIIIATIDELEKLLPALEEELAATATAAKEQALASIPQPPPTPVVAVEQQPVKEQSPKPKKTDAQWIKEKDNAVAQAKKTTEKRVKEASDLAFKQGVNSLLELIYYANVFDTFVPYNQMPAFYERHAALALANMHNIPLLVEDFDTIALFGKLLTSKPYGASISHAEALERCQDLAYKYTNEPHVAFPGTQITGQQLREKLAAVTASGYPVLVPKRAAHQSSTAGVPVSGPIPSAPMAPLPAYGGGYHQQYQHNYVHATSNGNGVAAVAAYDNNYVDDSSHINSIKPEAAVLSSEAVIKPVEEAVEEEKVVKKKEKIQELRAPSPTDIPAPKNIAALPAAAPTSTNNSKPTTANKKPQNVSTEQQQPHAKKENLVDHLFGGGANKPNKSSPSSPNSTDNKSQQETKKPARDASEIKKPVEPARILLVKPSKDGTSVMVTDVATTGGGTRTPRANGSDDKHAANTIKDKNTNGGKKKQQQAIKDTTTTTAKTKPPSQDPPPQPASGAAPTAAHAPGDDNDAPQQQQQKKKGRGRSKAAKKTSTTTTTPRDGSLTHDDDIQNNAKNNNAGNAVEVMQPQQEEKLVNCTATTGEESVVSTKPKNRRRWYKNRGSNGSSKAGSTGP